MIVALVPQGGREWATVAARIWAKCPLSDVVDVSYIPRRSRGHVELVRRCHGYGSRDHENRPSPVSSSNWSQRTSTQSCGPKAGSQADFSTVT